MKANALLRPNYIRATVPTHVSVLVVDDSPHDFQHIKYFLSKVDHSRYSLEHADSMIEASKLIAEQAFDIVLLDYKIGNELGLGFLGTMKRLGIDIPVVMLSHLDSIDVDLQSLHVGCIEYIPKSELSPGNLERSIRYGMNNHRVLKELLYVASHDDMTGLLNRTLLFDRIEHALSKIERTKSGCALLSCDLDNFKSINDNFGHPAGDEVLVECARRMQTVVRKSDTLARLGGDEFMILLEEVDQDAANQVAQKLVNEIQKPIAIESTLLNCECSVGIVYIPYQENSPPLVLSEVLKQVDRALYENKQRKSVSAKH